MNKKRKPSRAYKLGVSILLVVSLLLLIWSIQSFLKENISLYFQSQLQKKPSIILKDATVVGRAHGEKRWEVKSDSVVISEDKRKAQYKDLKEATIYREEEPYIKLKARFIIMDIDTKDITATGGVEIESASGEKKFYTKELIWKEKEEKLICPGKVKIITPDGVYYARSMTGNLKTGKMELLDVRAEMKVDLDEFK